MEQDLKQLILEVLEKGYLMSLGVQDDGGVWVADVIYIFDEDLNIYWMSDPDVRHSKAILENNQIAGTITVNGAGEHNLGIQFSGTAEKIEEARYDLAKKHYVKRQKPEPKEEDDVLQGDSWYVLRPRRIDLSNEKLFGFTKKSIEL